MSARPHHRSRRTAAPVMAPVMAALAALAGCGVPSDGAARTLGTPPFGLLTSTTTQPPTTVPPDEEGFPLTLYWASPDDQIVPGEPIRLSQAPTFQEVLDLLVEGPPSPTGEDGDDAGSGGSGTTTTTTAPSLRTYITEGLNPEDEDEEHRAVGPLVVEVTDGTLDVLVDDRFREESQATPTRFRLAIAQVVCTVTQFDNVDAVQFFDSQGQLTLVNLEQLPIETATRENIGRCEPAPEPDPTSTTTRRSSANGGQVGGGAPSSLPPATTAPARP